MIYLFIFLFEIIFLFFLSKRLVNSVSRLIYKITGSHSAVVNFLAVLFLPGTIIHELSHLLIAGILLIPVGELSVLPQVEGNSIKLGSVEVGKSDPLRMMIVGVAPVLVGVSSILGILYFLQSGNNFVWWQMVLCLFLVFEIGNSMFSSKKDLEGVIGFIVAILTVSILIFAGIYFLNQPIYQHLLEFFQSFNYQPQIYFFKQSSIFLLVPLALDLIIILITRFL